MNMKTFLIIIAVAIFVCVNSVFILPESHQALVFQFKEIIRSEKEPGLKFKIPFIQNPVYFDSRILNIDIDLSDAEIITQDNNRVLVNAFAKYRITDLTTYYLDVKNEARLTNLITKSIQSGIREVISQYVLSDLLSTKREEISSELLRLMQSKIDGYGVELIDVQFMRTNLPDQNNTEIYQRMITHYTKQAAQFIAEGTEEANKITSNAQKDVKIILSTARKDSEIIRGKAEAKVTEIFAKAYGGEKEEFYKFYHSMQLYKDIFNEKDSQFVLSQSHDLMKYMKIE